MTEPLDAFVAAWRTSVSESLTGMLARFEARFGYPPSPPHFRRTRPRRRA